MLAAELLQRDGYYRESRPILEAINRRLDEDQVRVSLRLGDARFHEEVQEDRPTFRSRASLEACSERSKRRGDYGSPASPGPGDHADRDSRLSQLSSPRADSGAEALYLLGQVDQIKTSEDAIAEFGSWMRQFGAKTPGSDVPERFWNVYSAHVREAQIGRWFGAAMHESVWHKTVKSGTGPGGSLLGRSGLR